MRMNISKQKNEFTREVEARVSFNSDSFANALDYKQKSSVFLAMSSNRDLFNLSNDHDFLNVTCNLDRRVSVKFFVSEYTTHTEVEFTIVEPKLRFYGDLTCDSDDEQILFRERMRVEVLTSDYDEQDTTRVVHEFAASVALAIANKISE